MHKPTAMSKMKVLLAKLSKSEDIRQLENGKFNVFWSNQDQYSEFTPERIKNLEQDGENLRLQINELKAEKDDLSKEINALKSRPKQDMLKEQLAEVTSKLEQAQTKAAQLTTNGGTPIDPKARDKLIKKGKEWLKLWRTRKETLMDALDQMAEGMNKKTKKLADDMDLETNIGIKPAPYKILKDKFSSLTANMQSGGSGTKRKK